MHYELYIDLFFLENFMMDSLLLFVTERITGGKYSFKGVLSGAFLGSVLTCLMVVVSVPAWMKNIAFYLVIPFCMLWLKNRKQCMLQILKGMGLLYLFGMFLGGTLMMFRPYLHYISLFYGIAVLSSQGILMAWKFLKVLKIEQERCCEVILFTETDSYKVHALRDTGNCLTDPLSGEGVHVLDCNFYHQVMKEAMKFRYIPYRSVHGSGIMKIFRIRKMCVEINEKEWIESPLIGVSESPISGEEDYQLILNCKVQML